MKKLHNAIFTIGSFTMLSRVVGLFRDLLIAVTLGAGPIADAFFVALKIPNLFRRFTAEGAFSASFVPIFSSLLTKDQEKAEDFADKTLSMLVSFLIPFSVLMIIIMPWFLYLIAPGFASDPYKYNLALELSRITFPFLLFTSIVAMFGGMLNSVGKYAPFAGAPIIFNLSLIVSLLLPQIFSNKAYQMAIAIPVSGVLQLLLMAFFFRKTLLKIKLVKPRFGKSERKFLKLLSHGIMGSGVVQINIFVGTLLASLLPTGAISYLYYADRLNQLPIGVIGCAIGTAMLPMLSKAIASKNEQESIELLNKSLMIGLFCAVASAVALFIMAEPIIDVIFNHGKFTDADVIACAKVLRAYVFGLPAYILIKVFANVFFAKHDTKTPMITSSISAVCNIVIAVALLKPFGYVGIASAAAISSWVNVILLYRKQDIEILNSSKIKMLKLFAIMVVFAGILYLGEGLLSEQLYNNNFWIKILYLSIVLGVSGIFVLASSFLNKILH